MSPLDEAIDEAVKIDRLRFTAPRPPAPLPLHDRSIPINKRPHLPDFSPEPAVPPVRFPPKEDR